MWDFYFFFKGKIKPVVTSRWWSWLHIKAKTAFVLHEKSIQSLLVWYVHYAFNDF